MPVYACVYANLVLHVHSDVIGVWLLLQAGSQEPRQQGCNNRRTLDLFLRWQHALVCSAVLHLHLLYLIHVEHAVGPLLLLLLLLLRAGCGWAAAADD
jgi:UPF0716 family protein affecting phage T7 exclusion